MCSPSTKDASTFASLGPPSSYRGPCTHQTNRSPSLSESESPSASLSEPSDGLNIGQPRDRAGPDSLSGWLKLSSKGSWTSVQAWSRKPSDHSFSPPRGQFFVRSSEAMNP